MASLVLTAAASAVSSSMGLGVVGTALFKAGAGLAGAVIDQRLFGGRRGERTITQEGPRLKSLDVTASTEGAPIPRAYGRVRLGGEMIWATDLIEEVRTEVTSTTTTQQTSTGGGGKGFGGGGGSATTTTRTTTTTYHYFANVALGIAEGPVDHLVRVWADGKELDLTGLTYRFHTGAEDQAPDALIEAKLGAGNAPAYRGLCYIVFEHLPLEQFGNRIPQFSFEVVRVVGETEPLIKAVNVIPGATEFGYATEPVRRVSFSGQGDVVWSAYENRNVSAFDTDWDASMEELARVLPGVEAASLVVAWFGDDLRAGHCTVRPRVDNALKATQPISWTVSGAARGDVPVVSLFEGRPAYGGTPSDQTVVQAILDLKARGYATALYPFVMMDIAADNALPDPYGGAAQAPYPWRGRITCSPAPGQPGTADKTAGAAAQIAAFVGTCARTDFAPNAAAGTVAYSGPAEWSFRRLVLHYAHLAALAGGVDIFVIGTEMIGLTTVRDDTGAYPFVDALKGLAADCRAILGPGTMLTYAADWSEYHSHRPDDGSGDVLFPLDPLWADADIDAVGIDNYMPLSDWRAGRDQADWDVGAGRTIPHDLDYLRANIEGGEYYDWYYASEEDRIDQVRTPIADTAHGEHWLFRQKDVRNWWANAHHERPAGVRASTPTAWVPQAKPILFTEIGAPALDKGGNQPNVFFDPKSAESALPFFGSHTRDDVMQRRHLEAMASYWAPAAGNNPTSSVYAGPMIDPRMFVWAWDARPWPAFPHNEAVWTDGPNWYAGHWVSGRMGAVTLDRLIATILKDHGFADYEIAPIVGDADGYVIDRVMSARAALEPVLELYGIDAIETGGRIRFVGRRGDGPRRSLTLDDLADPGGPDPVEFTRRQASELPGRLKLSYAETARDYQPGAVEALGANASERVAQKEIALVLDQPRAQALADQWIHRNAAAREQASLVLMPSLLALEPADVIAVTTQRRAVELRLDEIVDGEARRVTGETFIEDVYGAVSGPPRATAFAPPVAASAVHLFLIDLPLLRDTDPAPLLYAAASGLPFPGVIARREVDDVPVGAPRVIADFATIGRTTTDLYAGPTGRWDRGNAVSVELFAGALLSRSQTAVLAGANAAAIETAPDRWEIVQFLNAELVAERTYTLSMLLRGQLGTEHAIVDPVPAGARFAMLDSGIGALPVGVADIGLDTTWRYAPANRGFDDPAARVIALAIAGRALQPLSPVHARARRDAVSGDVTLSWIRRTRIGGDAWEIVDVPLGEEREAYEVDLFDGAEVVRTLKASAQSVVYTAAEQMADFGALPDALTFAVFQLSGVVGRGAGTKVTRNV